MSVNSSPNLFRLSLPEWLKEQVDSGKHKGVYWIDKKDKIFHVPWKHASRNGWEDGDVSLFKAWAIYTNRYREGVDKARPALWKTNFRCAINSHNSIAFLKDQGQRKGDKAHRIMKLIEPPKKGREPLNGNEHVEQEPPRKLVRLTYPNFGPPPPDGVPIERGKYRKASEKTGKSKTTQKTVGCEDCTFLKSQIQDALKIYNELHNEEEENVDFQAMKSTLSDLLSSQDHLCKSQELLKLMQKNLIVTTNTNAGNSDEFSKPNLQDLYFIGKALQTAEGNETLKVAIKVESEMEIVDTLYNHVSIQVGLPTKEDELSEVKDLKQDENKNEPIVEEKASEDVIVQDDGAVEVVAQQIEVHDGEDEELITPRL